MLYIYCESNFILRTVIYDDSSVSYSSSSKQRLNFLETQLVQWTKSLLHTIIMALFITFQSYWLFTKCISYEVHDMWYAERVWKNMSNFRNYSIYFVKIRNSSYIWFIISQSQINFFIHCKVKINIFMQIEEKRLINFIFIIFHKKSLSW